MCAQSDQSDEQMRGRELRSLVEPVCVFPHRTAFYPQPHWLFGIHASGYNTWQGLAVSSSIDHINKEPLPNFKCIAELRNTDGRGLKKIIRLRCNTDRLIGKVSADRKHREDFCLTQLCTAEFLLAKKQRLK